MSDDEKNPAQEEAVPPAPAEGAELSEEDLGKVAGGFGMMGITNTINSALHNMNGVISAAIKNGGH